MNSLATEYVGRRTPLFWLALRSSVLTVLTLGLYRFWMKTRLRRFYWSSVQPGGLPMEYVGEPLEKLLGFLIAVVFLAFYLGLVNLGLVFVSFSLFQTNVVAYVLSFIGVVPLWFYATYRARRYVLGRSRWMGLRLGMEPGAWGYAWRAMAHWAVTLLSLGILWPRMTFWLEKYRTDRTFFGTARLRQGGSVAMLWPVFVHVLIGFGGAGCTALIAAANDTPRFLLLLGVFVPWGLFGLVHYRVHALRLLTEGKTAGALGLIAQPRVGRVARIYLLGGFLAFILPVLVLGGGVGALILVFGGDAVQSLGPSADPGEMALPLWAQIGLGLLGYFAVFLTIGVLRHIFLLLPLWRHYAETLTITGTAALPTVGQRKRDTMDQAEGVAEALDVGAAI